ncbi:GNAT family N-acetyltransferase [Georgenia sp. TF02-10]|uniref:GNAT family N-acetyltransferase n=1 Tax=Georgenia sp. TF02-10 TaxID=2917725 RepID=UPI001FA705B6|nr:GNAT family N-acetyltransferase [Georgenia sp. TF02-10]UNX54543.1 GNAT family N-acetyltransferase [Georgenia sp. TF02-10]
MTSPAPGQPGPTTAPPVRIIEGQAASERATKALAQYFAELDERFAGGFDPALVEAADPEDVTPPHGDFLLLTELGTGKLLGCGGVRKLPSGDIELRRMWLVPDARGRGLGRFLLRALENRARALGGTRLVLSANEALVEALALYRSAGYTPTEPFEDNPYVQVFLGKDL